MGINLQSLLQPSVKVSIPEPSRAIVRRSPLLCSQQLENEVIDLDVGESVNDILIVLARRMPASLVLVLLGRHDLGIV